MRYWITISCLFLCFSSQSQSSLIESYDSSKNSITEDLQAVPQKLIIHTAAVSSKLSEKVSKQNAKMLKLIEQGNDRVYKKLHSVDSTKAKQFFDDASKRYKSLLAGLKDSATMFGEGLREYIPKMDSLSTVFKFLQQPSATLPTDRMSDLQNVSTKISSLQGALKQAEVIQSFIKERQQQLTDLLENTPFVKELLTIKKQSYYYQQQVMEYKTMLKQPDKMIQKAIDIARNMPAFKSFWEKNSYLSQLFPTSPNAGTALALQGLQTRLQLQQQTNRLFSGSSVNPQQYLQQQFQSAQNKLTDLKNKLNNLGGGNSDMVMPDFKPNSQKTKTFWKRLEYGLNAQNQKSSFLLPATTDIALTAGYKISDGKAVGIGMSYKMGWGNGFRDIRLTNEGIGMRSYIDIKLKGNIWASGGLEYNYLQSFANITAIKNLDVWQRSALLGITKHYKVGKKTGEAQLLYDFLARKQVPQAQALKFRIGWKF